MKNLNRIIVFALLCALTLTATVLFTSAASTEVEIEKCTVNFDDGEITMNIAVKSDALPHGGKLSVVDDITAKGPLYENPEYTVMNLDGTEYKVFTTAPIFIQNLRLPYHFTVTSFDVAGKDAISSKVFTYSVFDYFIDMCDTAPQDQIDLFIKLLEIGASMQKNLLGSAQYSERDFNLAGGYSNEYCILKLNTFLDGELQSTEELTFNKNAEIALRPEKSLKGATFCGFTDKGGEQLRKYGALTSQTFNEYDLVADKIGVTEINLNYDSSLGEVVGYDTHFSVSGYGITADSGTKFGNAMTKKLTVDKKGVASSTYVAYTANVALASKGESKYLGFYKIMAVTEATVYENEGANTSGAYKKGEIVSSVESKNCGIYLPNNAKAENADYTVFETDFYLYTPTNTSATHITLLNSDGEAVWGFNLKSAGGGATFTLVTDSDNGSKPIGEGISLAQRTWHNLRLEYRQSDDGIVVKAFINGKFTEESFFVTSANAQSNFSSVRIYHADSLKNVTLLLDNTIISDVK